MSWWVDDPRKVGRWLPVWLIRWHFEPNALFPRGYGLAWHDLQWKRSAIMPIPLNTIIALARRALVWIAYDAGIPTRLDRRLEDVRKKAYDRGFSDRDQEFVARGPWRVFR